MGLRQGGRMDKWQRYFCTCFLVFIIIITIIGGVVLACHRYHYRYLLFPRFLNLSFSALCLFFSLSGLIFSPSLSPFLICVFPFSLPHPYLSLLLFTIFLFLPFSFSPSLSPLFFPCLSLLPSLPLHPILLFSFSLSLYPTSPLIFLPLLFPFPYLSPILFLLPYLSSLLFLFFSSPFLTFPPFSFSLSLSPPSLPLSLPFLLSLSHRPSLPLLFPSPYFSSPLFPFP